MNRERADANTRVYNRFWDDAGKDMSKTFTYARYKEEIWLIPEMSERTEKHVPEKADYRRVTEKPELTRVV